MLLRSNPFATRFTRPGVLPPLDATGAPVRVDEVLRRLRGIGRAAAVVGPHGSGKSTLLARLADAIDADGGVAIRLRLRDRGDRGPVLAAVLRARPGAVVVLDGWETAGPLVALIVRTVARLRGCRLVVTAHGAVGLPVLVRCRTTAALLAAIVDRLPGRDAWYGRLIHPADVAEAFAGHGGDIRESLFALYDRYERRVRGGGGDGRDDREAGADDAGAGSEIQETAAGFSCPGAPGRNLR